MDRIRRIRRRRRTSSEKASSETSVRIFIRIRPMIKWEVEKGGSMSDIYFNSPSTISVKTKIHDLVTFRFNRVFDCSSTQLEVYNEVVTPLFAKFIDGRNCTILAYGQTTSGKSYTMTNYQRDKSLHGITPRIIESVFNKIRRDRATDEYTVQICYFEIYLGKIIDLLVHSKSRGKKKKSQKSPRIRLISNHDKESNFRFVGMCCPVVRNKRETFRLLSMGERNKKVFSTDLSEGSSRSHSIFQIILTNKRRGVVSHFSLVDLAGSERIMKTNSHGVRKQEAIFINKSLSTLGKVIHALNLSSGKTVHIPYRESKLTMFLKESLGSGDGYASMIMTCSPCSFNTQETISTLRFGQTCQTLPTIRKRHSISSRSSHSVTGLIDRERAKVVELRQVVKKQVKELSEIRNLLLVKERNEQFLETELMKNERRLKESISQAEKFKDELRVKKEESKLLRIELDSERCRFEKEKKMLITQLERIENFIEFDGSEPITPIPTEKFDRSFFHSSPLSPKLHTPGSVSRRFNRSLISYKGSERTEKEEEEEEMISSPPKSVERGSTTQSSLLSNTSSEEEEDEEFSTLNTTHKSTISIPKIVVNDDDEEEEEEEEEVIISNSSVEEDEEGEEEEEEEDKNETKQSCVIDSGRIDYLLEHQSRASYVHLIEKLNEKDESILELEDEVYSLKRELCLIKINQMDKLQSFSERVITKMNNITKNNQPHHKSFKGLAHPKIGKGVITLRETLSSLLKKQFVLEKRDLVIEIRRIHRDVSAICDDIAKKAKIIIPSKKRRFVNHWTKNGRRKKRRRKLWIREGSESTIHSDSLNKSVDEDYDDEHQEEDSTEKEEEEEEGEEEEEEEEIITEDSESYMSTTVDATTTNNSTLNTTKSEDLESTTTTNDNNMNNNNYPSRPPKNRMFLELSVGTNYDREKVGFVKNKKNTTPVPLIHLSKTKKKKKKIRHFSTTTRILSPVCPFNESLSKTNVCGLVKMIDSRKLLWKVRWVQILDSKLRCYEGIHSLIYFDVPLISLSSLQKYHEDEDKKKCHRAAILNNYVEKKNQHFTEIKMADDMDELDDDIEFNKEEEEKEDSKFYGIQIKVRRYVKKTIKFSVGCDDDDEEEEWYIIKFQNQQSRNKFFSSMMESRRRKSEEIKELVMNNSFRESRSSTLTSSSFTTTEDQEEEEEEEEEEDVI